MLTKIKLNISFSFPRSLLLSLCFLVLVYYRLKKMSINLWFNIVLCYILMGICSAGYHRKNGADYFFVSAPFFLFEIFKNKNDNNNDEK